MATNNEQVGKLKRQNDMLKNQLDLRKENADLKTANILAQILSMMEKMKSSTDLRVEKTYPAEKTYSADTTRQAPDMPSSTATKVVDPDLSRLPNNKVKLTCSEDYKGSPHLNPDCSVKSGRLCDNCSGPMRKNELCSPVAGASYRVPPPQYRCSPNCDGPPVLRSLGLSSVHEDSVLRKEEHSANVSSDNVLPITPRLIGEIAFQLDRRLLSYIFNGHGNCIATRRRFYGFTIQNIGEMIEIECLKSEKSMDEQAKMAMSYRYQYIFNRMKMLGYELKFHPLFSIRMVNQFGLLNVSGHGMGQSLQLQDPDILQAILVNITPKDCLKDVLILLDCLVFLAHDEGRPLFVY